MSTNPVTRLPVAEPAMLATWRYETRGPTRSSGATPAWLTSGKTAPMSVVVSATTGRAAECSPRRVASANAGRHEEAEQAGRQDGEGDPAHDPAEGRHVALAAQPAAGVAPAASPSR